MRRLGRCDPRPSPPHPTPPRYPARLTRRSPAWTSTSKGLATRRAVLGDAYVDQALAKATPFTAPLQELVTRHAWGNTWQRDGIDLRTRSIVTVSMLVALGRMHELKIHVRGALNNGVTPAGAAGDLPARQRLLRVPGRGGCLPQRRRGDRRAPDAAAPDRGSRSRRRSGRAAKRQGGAQVAPRSVWAALQVGPR
jgi:alkylhydroperoxidase/carboxymuconolactone decarboxylase family protein YurZ